MADGIERHPSDPDRDVKGRFLPGWRGGPGTPAWRHASALRRAMMVELSPDEMASLARRIYNVAMNGDVRAAEWAAQRTVGAPVQVDYAARIARIEAALGLDAEDEEAEEQPAASSNGNGHHPPTAPRGPF